MTAHRWADLRTSMAQPIGSRPLPELLVLKAPPLVVLSRLQVAPGEARLRLGESTPLHLAVEEGCEAVKKGVLPAAAACCRRAASYSSRSPARAYTCAR